MILAADTDIWRWQPHPEVWMLVIGAVALAWYAVRVIAPHAVPPGEPVVTRRNTVAYVAAIVLLWIASDWPMHDISEEYLYSAHMVQHFLISMVVPPLLLVATPEWLARLVMSSDGRAGVWARRLSHPVVAGVAFNVVIAVSHLTSVVNTSLDNGPFHYLVHFLVFTTAMMMWVPVIGPVPELRLSNPGQIVYLFLMSVIPTVPAGFLTFAEGIIYEAYDHGVRVWGISATNDQQLAGVIMKLGGGIYLWSWIVVRFFQWHGADKSDRELALVETEPLTYEEVRAEFEAAGPAPSEA